MGRRNCVTCAVLTSRNIRTASNLRLGDYDRRGALRRWRRVVLNQQILQFCVATTLALSLVACRAATEPATPGVVPAGAMDAAWVNIGKNCTPSSPVTRVPENKRDSLPPYTHGPTRSVDDDWADAARLIPGGWGGLWLEAGVPTMYLVDTGQRNDAIAGLQARGFGSTLQLGETVVKPGRWDFAQLADWYRYLSLHVLFSGLPGIS